jgi:hypothetical protein
MVFSEAAWLLTGKQTRQRMKHKLVKNIKNLCRFIENSFVNRWLEKMDFAVTGAVCDRTGAIDANRINAANSGFIVIPSIKGMSRFTKQTLGYFNACLLCRITGGIHLSI